MSIIDKNVDLNLIKNIHRFTHATFEERKHLLKHAVTFTNELSEACDTVFDSYTICASSGRPKHKCYISLTHVNEAFNQEVQADFTLAYIGAEKIGILSIVDLGTNNGERAIAPTRDTLVQ